MKSKLKFAACIATTCLIIAAALAALKFFITADEATIDNYFVKPLVVILFFVFCILPISDRIYKAVTGDSFICPPKKDAK